jgi:hypothetical protein
MGWCICVLVLLGEWGQSPFPDTFAMHFMMNGGDILTLQRGVGHTTLAMTQKYAHFSPGHMAEVVSLNPLAGIFEKKRKKKSWQGDSVQKMKLDVCWTEGGFWWF